ncbi:hypothetical protein CHH75_20365 [Paenibacillus sp. 7541]|nr:hypothetical protein CHH75_20365 [Paenibacillus sp. 7541]
MVINVKNGILLIVFSFFVISIIYITSFPSLVKFLLVMLFIIAFWIYSEHINEFISNKRNIKISIIVILLTDLLLASIAIWSIFKIENLSSKLSVSSKENITELFFLIEKYTWLNGLSSYFAMITFIFFVALLLKFFNLKRAQTKN